MEEDKWERSTGQERFSVDYVDDNRDDANSEIDNGLFFEDWLDGESDDSATEDEECRELKTIAATISLAATDSSPTTPSTDAMRPMPRSPPSDPILRGLFEHQKADDELNAVYEAVAAGQPPPQGISLPLRRAWHSFLTNDGLLYKNVASALPRFTGDTLSVPVLPQSAIPIVLRALHSDEFQRHPGILRLWTTLRSTAWFNDMYDTVSKHVNTCPSCSLDHQRYDEPRPGVQRTSPPWSWHTLAADVLSVSTPTFKQLVLVLVCLHSHYIFAIPIPNKSSRTIASKLRELVKCYGPFSVLMCDRGLEFAGSDTQLVLQQYGIRFQPTLPYSPLSSIEQVNRTLLERLQRIYTSRPFTCEQFPAVLEEVLWDLRLTASSVTKLPPYSLFFGRPPPGQPALLASTFGTSQLVADMLQARRDLALTAQSTSSTFYLYPGQLLYYRDHRYDRQCKIAQRWVPAKLLTLHGVKATLVGFSGNVVIRHIRELISHAPPLPSPPPTTTMSPSPSPLSQLPRTATDLIHVLPTVQPLLQEQLIVPSTPSEDQSAHSSISISSSSSSAATIGRSDR
ncbi:hypothetical protein FOZ63_029081, partial [Perkinsus olseni]